MSDPPKSPLKRGTFLVPTKLTYHKEEAMQTISTLNESQQIRLANFVKKLMPTDSAFQESLNETDTIAIAIDMFTDEIPEDKRRPVESIDDRELEKIIYDVMILEAVSGTLNELSPEEIAIFDDAVKRQKYVG